MKSYSNNQEIVTTLNALRTCIDRRHYGLYKKIIGGVKCDTTEQVKLSLIAYLLIEYQRNDETCLEQSSSKKGWQILNRFIAYVKAECRDCIQTYASSLVGNAGASGTPTPVEYNFVTQSGDTIITQSGNTIQKL